MSLITEYVLVCSSTAEIEQLNQALLDRGRQRPAVWS